MEFTNPVCMETSVTGIPCCSRAAACSRRIIRMKSCGVCPVRAFSRSWKRVRHIAMCRQSRSMSNSKSLMLSFTIWVAFSTKALSALLGTADCTGISSAPFCNPSMMDVLKVLAVSSMTGIPEVAGVLFIRWHISSPGIPGIIISDNTKLGYCVSIYSSASCALDLSMTR